LFDRTGEAGPKAEDPRVFVLTPQKKNVDTRDKRGHDERRIVIPAPLF
jgi:hypothetical protein